MGRLLTLAEASAEVHQQYLDYKQKEQARWDREAAEIREQEDRDAWWVIERWLETQEGIDRLTKAISEAQAKLNGATVDEQS